MKSPVFNSLFKKTFTLFKKKDQDEISRPIITDTPEEDPIKSIASTLHIEILLQILNQIHFDNVQNDKRYPLKSFHSCALVNKHWCFITIPLLYKSIMDRDDYLNELNLMRTLIKFLDQEQVQELTVLGVDITEDFNGKRMMFDYPRFIKELNYLKLNRMVTKFIDQKCNDELINTFVKDKGNGIKDLIVRVNTNENGGDSNDGDGGHDEGSGHENTNDITNNTNENGGDSNDGGHVEGSSHENTNDITNNNTNENGGDNDGDGDHDEGSGHENTNDNDNTNLEGDAQSQSHTSTIPSNGTEINSHDTTTITDHHTKVTRTITYKHSTIRDQRILSLVKKSTERELSSSVKKKITRIRTDTLLSSLLNMFVKYDVTIKKLSLDHHHHELLLKNERFMKRLGESVNEVDVTGHSGALVSSGILNALEKNTKNLKSLNIKLLNERKGRKIYKGICSMMESRSTITTLHFTNMKFSRLIHTIFYNSHQIRHLQFTSCEFRQEDRFDCIFACKNLLGLSFTFCKSINNYIKKWTKMKKRPGYELKERIGDYIDKYGLTKDCLRLSENVKVKISENQKEWNFSKMNGENGEIIVLDNVYGNVVKWLQKSGFKDVETYNETKILKDDLLVKIFKR